jgi:ADP-ribose pyrophosphatase YjhB (NUDIX family)
MDQSVGAEVRCSAVVFRDREILLVRRSASGDWVLPGGTPHPAESMAACARRETREETGLAVEPARIAFVLESLGPRPGLHIVDLVFLAALSEGQREPRSAEPELSPAFVPLSELHQLDLRPPIAGHLRGLHARGTARTAAYLGNLWRPRRPDELMPALFTFTEDPPD